MFTLYIEHAGYLFTLKVGQIAVNDNSATSPLELVKLFTQMIELREAHGFMYPCASGAYEIDIVGAVEELETARQEALEDGGGKMFDPGPLSYQS